MQVEKRKRKISIDKSNKKINLNEIKTPFIKSHVYIKIIKK